MADFTNLDLSKRIQAAHMILERRYLETFGLDLPNSFIRPGICGLLRGELVVMWVKVHPTVGIPMPAMQVREDLQLEEILK